VATFATTATASHAVTDLLGRGHNYHDAIDMAPLGGASSPVSISASGAGATAASTAGSNLAQHKGTSWLMTLKRNSRSL
jgi:hypothetical protein